MFALKRKVPAKLYAMAATISGNTEMKKNV